MAIRKPVVELHIGMPKCGSSALQTALSLSAGDKSVKKMKYVSIRSDGEVLSGISLMRAAKVSESGYVPFSKWSPVC